MGQAYKVLLTIEYGKISNSTSSQFQGGPIQFCLDMRLYKPCSDLTEPNFALPISYETSLVLGNVIKKIAE